jgi:hypothetical protein
MVSSQARRERVQAVVAEMIAAELAECGDDSHEDINDIEDAMVEIGDAVAREFAVQKLARRTQRPEQPPPCARCGHASEDAGSYQRRIITRRGEVPIQEAKYRCPKCRRHFFPSVGSLGD